MKSFFPKLAKWFVPVIGGFILIAAILFFIREGSGLENWRKSGNIKGKLHIVSSNDEVIIDSLAVFSEIDTTDFLSKPFPTVNDTIIQFNDLPATRNNWVKEVRGRYQSDSTVTLLMVSNQDTLITKMRLQPVEDSEILQTSALGILRFLIVVLFWAVGFWAYVKQPDSGAVRALSLFSFSMAILLMMWIQSGLQYFAVFEIPFEATIFNILGMFAILLGGFWLNLQLLFPRPRKLIAQHPIVAYLLCYGAPIIGMIMVLIVTTLVTNYIVVSIAAAQIWVGFFILGSYHSRAPNLLEKRQTRLVLWGSGIGLFLWWALLVLVMLAGSWLGSLKEYQVVAILIVVFLGLLLSPLSFAYAFGKYRLLEVEGKIRRGTRYAAVTAVLLLVFYLIIYGASEIVLKSLGVQQNAPVLFMALILAIGFAPTQRKLQIALEKRFYPERSRLRTLLRNFLSQSLIVSEKKAFWTELEQRLKEVLRVDLVYPILRSENTESLTRWNGEETPFRSDSEFIKDLENSKRPHIMVDEAIASDKISFNEEEKKWLIDNQIALILPMFTRSRLVGFLAIGYKTEKKDFEPIDLDILHSLANQIAIAGENITLMEENLDKRRLEHELGMARQVQEGLLPQTIPDTPGLEVAASSKFCLEVAGDYYDVMNLDEKRTVLAVGDVSGKGAGAAILMSNLQASFRTAVSIGARMSEVSGKITTLTGREAEKGDAQTGIQLSDIIARINNLIHRNSPPDQFITFFSGVYDTGNSTFSYVNAGHNHPFLVRKDGAIKELSKGGLLLGAMPGMPYEQDVIELHGGDLVFLYTDGVSEAENSDGEMYGEEKIKEHLKANFDRPLTEILKDLELKVREFIGEVPLGDDFTILAARVKSAEEPD